MPWVRIDDHFDEHPKLASVGPLGWAMWLAGLAYCNRNLTDGFIPWAVASNLVPWEYLGPDGDVIRVFVTGRPVEVNVGDDWMPGVESVTGEYVLGLLVAGGVWEKVRGGYRIHDYGEYQPTKAQIMAERAAKAAAGRAGGVATAIARAKAPAVADGVAKPQPVPNPVPVPDSQGSQAHTVAREEPEGLSEGEAHLLSEIAQNGAFIRPDSPLGIRLFGLIDRRGIEAVSAEAQIMRKGDKLSDRQWVLGLENRLESIPTGREAATEAVEEANEAKSNAIYERMATRRLEWFRQTGKWDEGWGPQPEGAA